MKALLPFDREVELRILTTRGLARVVVAQPLPELFAELVLGVCKRQVYLNRPPAL
jgi:hypothetical protein